MSALDWPGMLRVALTPGSRGGLGLRPAEFWRLTPAELALMLGEPRGMRPLDRSGLDLLMGDWPDAKGNGDA